MHDLSENLIDIILRVEPLLLGIDEPAASMRPGPGKWSKKEILGHLLDSAGNNQQKFVRTQLAPGGHLDLTGYAQDDWVLVQHYQSAEWPQLVAFWKHYNLQLAHTIRHCPPEKHANTISIEGAGPFRLDFIMADYVEHLKHHLRAIIPQAGLESTFSNVYNA